MKEHQNMTGLAASGISRRRFFGYAGALAGAGLLTGIASCKKDDEDGGIDLGTGDLGLINYACMLEQLEAAFYAELFQLPYVGILPHEQAYLQDIRDHGTAHHGLLRALLGSSAIQMLTPDFSSVRFNERSSVLTTARTLKDLLISAYNGAGKLFTNTPEGAGYFLLTAKIVSVKARHSAIIREVIQQHSFADTSILDPAKRIDMARTPAEVLAIVDTYFFERLNGSNLPSF